MKIKNKERVIPYLFLIPAFLGLSIFRVLPVFSSLFDSFTTTSFVGGVHQEFCFLDNYKYVFTDPTFLGALKNTGIFIVTIVPFEIAWAFLLAILVSKPFKGVSIFRTVFFIPFTISLAITSTIWGIMYNPNGGFVNSILALLNLPLGEFLISKKQALPSIIFLVSWRVVGYWMIFLLSGLQNIPKQLYESAWMDGARSHQSFFYITLPMMKNTFIFVLVANTTQNILMFTPMYILTGGGPENSTNVAMYEAYKNVFIYSDRGVGNAMVMIMIVLILSVVFLQFRLIQGGKND